MATNHYFNNVPRKQNDKEQALYEDLINECIFICGHDVQYFVRESRDEIDLILGEDPTSKFTNYYTMEMYVETTKDFLGDQDYMSKFGLEIRDHTKLLVTGRTFARCVPPTVAIRPREGDLIYSQLFNKMFEITFVKNDPIFHTHGRKAVSQAYAYELSCQAFKYSHEKISSGIPEIDSILGKHGHIIEIFMNVGANTFNYIIGEEVYQGVSYALADAKAEVVDWNRDNGSLKLAHVNGDFVVGNTVIGIASNTQYYATGHDALDTKATERITDNLLFERESNTSIDTSETSPFWRS